MQHSRLAVLVLLTAWAVLPASVRAQQRSDYRPVPILSAISGEWLHLGGQTLDRDGSQSFALGVAHDRPNGLRLELGYLRAARALTNAEGLTAGMSYPVKAGRFTVRPGLSLLVGAAEAAVDREGYDWRGSDGTTQNQTGHQGRPLDMNGTTVGAGLRLGGEMPLAAGVSLTGSVRQWLFTGTVLRGHRTSTLIGFGLSVHPNDVLTALR